MKKVFNKALCAVLLLSLVFSSFSLIPSTVSAENSYTYEKETEVNVSMNAENWVKNSAVNDDNTSLTSVTNSLDGSTSLYIKNTAKPDTSLGHTWVPYENAEAKTQYDITKVTKFEVTAIFNSDYGVIPFGYNTTSNNIYSISLHQNQATGGSRMWVNETGVNANWASGVTITNNDPAYDFKNNKKSTSTIKAVFEADTYLDGLGKPVSCVNGSFYNVVEGKDELMFTMIQKGNVNIYPSIGSFVNDSGLNIEIKSMKVTYKKTVDATADVEKIVSKYSALTGLSSAADITKANAATVINEINNFTAEFKTLDSKLQSILVNADVYNADRFSAYKSYAQNLINGVIGQYFDNDVSTGKNVDDLWSVRGNVTNITVSDGSFKMNATGQELTLTNGLSTAPKSMVIKAKFADNTETDHSAGFFFKYAQKIKDTGKDNGQVWFHIPAYKNDDETKLIAKNMSGNSIRGKIIKINSTDADSWGVDGKITYPEGDDAIVIGNYVDGTYVPNTITTKIDYVLNDAKDKYFLTLTISDPEGHSTTYASKAYIPNSEDVSDYGLTVSGMPYDNTSNYKTVANYGEIESIEYLMAGSDITAPTLDGVRFKDIAKGEADIAFQISSNASLAPEGYTPVAYGAYIITNAKLNGAYDIINADYTGKGGLKAIQAQKEVSDGKVPDTYLVSVAKSAAVSGETSFKGYRFAAVGYITYADESGNTVTVYTGNTTENTNVVLGQGNRSVVGVAKVIAATEIKNGAADTDNAISTIINKTTATTVAEQDTLIKFVCDNQSFIKQ